MLVGPDHDCIRHTRDNLGGIRYRFSATQLHRAAVHHNTGAAKLADGDIERNASPRAALFKNHRQHMIGERLVRIRFALGPACPRRLAIDRIGNHRGNGIAPRISEIEKMPAHDSGA